MELNSTWSTFGHQKVKNILQSQLLAKTLAQTYLFLGPEGIGKKILARELAGKIIENSVLGNHPDFQILEAGESGIEEVRKFIENLSHKPFVAQKKVAIINDAHLLGLESSNALLKTLEEPKESTVIILIASQRLLPTIMSRCQVFNFSPFSEKQLKIFANENKLNAPVELLNLCFGSIGQMKKMAESKLEASRQEEIIKSFLKLKSQVIGDRLGQIGSFAEREAEELKQLVKSWLWYEKSLPGIKEGRLKNLQLLMETFQSFSSNKNKKLIFQRLFLNLPVEKHA